MGLDIDSSFGWPIAMRPGGDCLNNKPDTNLQVIPYGQSKVEMRANDGANHIGPCTVYLVNPDDATDKLQVGQLNDCMRSLHPGPGSKGDDPIPAEMSIDVPKSGLPCSPEHCVLEFYWEATHLDPHEIFNNCADVTLSGNSGDNESGSTNSTTTTPTVEHERNQSRDCRCGAILHNSTAQIRETEALAVESLRSENPKNLAPMDPY
ncbi:hypothetical protein DVH05_007685 [Phytophthora capsici]|nr:hypothetical protein DVH05_007685 [Phytophthora capsici]